MIKIGPLLDPLKVSNSDINLPSKTLFPLSSEKPKKLNPPVTIRYHISILLKPPSGGLKFPNPPVSITEILTVFERYCITHPHIIS